MATINISKLLKKEFEKERFFYGQGEERKVYIEEFFAVLLKTWQDVKVMKDNEATAA